jgi:hypothetical protein
MKYQQIGVSTEEAKQPKTQDCLLGLGEDIHQVSEHVTLTVSDNSVFFDKKRKL